MLKKVFHGELKGSNKIEDYFSPVVGYNIISKQDAYKVIFGIMVVQHRYYEGESEPYNFLIPASILPNLPFFFFFFRHLNLGTKLALYHTWSFRFTFESGYREGDDLTTKVTNS